MDWVKPPNRVSEWPKTYSVRVPTIMYFTGLVTITKIDSFSLQSERGKRVKLVVSLSLTTAGKARIDEQVKE